MTVTIHGKKKKVKTPIAEILEEAEIDLESKVKVGVRNGKPYITVPWKDLKDDFFTENLKEGGRYTLKELALKYKVNVKTVNSYAAKHKWYRELREARLEVQRDVEKGMITDREKVLDAVKGKALNDELVVRQRHLSLSRKLLIAANERLKLIDPKKLTIRETLEFLKLGIAEERKALGMVEDTNIIFKDSEENTDELTFMKANNVIGDILNIMKDSHGNYASFTDDGAEEGVISEQYSEAPDKPTDR